MRSKYIFEKMELDGEIIAVPIGDKAEEFSAVLNLNEEAMRILDLLQQETDEQSIIAQLLTEYDGTEEEIGPLVHSYIDKLRHEGLIEE